MAIGGWKTRSVFDRYNIVDEDDQRRAAVKRDAHLAAAQREAPKVRRLR